MGEEAVFLQREGRIARLVLNRPEKRNALDLAMWEALPGLVDEADADPAVQVVVVQGAGTAAFAAGADISEFEEIFATGEGRERYSDAVYAAEQRLGRCAKPTIAMIRGDCVGGGVEIALACDLRFAGTGSRFGVTPARLGLAYSLTSTRRLVQLIGPSRTLDLLYTGRLIGAEEAAHIGLIDRFCAPDMLEEAVLAYVGEIGKVSRYSVRASKRIVTAILEGATDETPESRALRVDGFAGEDAREGIRAYLEKRRPRFPSS